MIKDSLKDIVRYITSNIGLNGLEVEARANRELDSLVKRYFRSSDFTSKEDNRDFLRLIRDLKKIREIYQKGKPFVKNQKRGKKKGSPKIIYSLLKFHLKEGETEKAKERAKGHLDHIKEVRSKRTYYRHLKKIRELGIQI